MTEAACNEFLAARAAEQETAFLRLLERGVFGWARSPYRKLLQHAGVELGDVEKSVRSDGIESALGALWDAGVRVSLDEFKGRQPIVRGGLEIPVQSSDFDNPIAAAHLDVSSGGSRGRKRTVAIDLDGWKHDAAAQLLFMKGVGVIDRPLAVWRPVPPGGAGIERSLQLARLGLQIEHWFSQQDPGLRAMEMRYAVVLRYTLAAARRAGRPLPAPEFVPLGGAAKVAAWLAEQRTLGTPGYLDTNVSSALRVCGAAVEGGLDISGSFFRVGSEPYTPARAAVIEAVGCRAACHYAMAETGTIAFACGDADAVDDAHLIDGKLAVLARTVTRSAGDSIEAMVLSTLHPSAAKLMLNVESGDTATLVERRCACPLGSIGFDRHIHSISSYDKLTSEGMHFAQSDLLELLDEVLPRAIGGQPGDYQLMEEERFEAGGRGLARVALVVSPRVGPIDEAELLRTALAHLRSRSAGNRLMSELWAQADALRVVRREPFATSAAKVLPLRGPAPLG